MARLVPPARHTPLYRQPGGRSVNQRQVREHSRSRSLRKTFLEADAICVITAAFVGWYVEQQKNSRRYVHFCRLPQSPLKNFKKRIKKILFFLRFLKLNRRFHKSYLSCLAMSRWRGCVNKLGVPTVKKSTETARRSFRLEVFNLLLLDERWLRWSLLVSQKFGEFYDEKVKAKSIFSRLVSKVLPKKNIFD